MSISSDKYSKKNQHSTSVKINIKTDVVVVGAGPVGLFCIFELGLLDMKVVIVDMLDKPGGQCIELYPQKPIYDIPGIPKITGEELTKSLLKQIKPFNPQFLFNQTVVSYQEEPDTNTIRITTNQGITIDAKIIVLATGGGIFEPKKPIVENISLYEGKSVFYHIKNEEFFYNKNVVVSGGGDSALDWSLHLCHHTKSLTLVHRHLNFKATPHSINKIMENSKNSLINIFIGNVNKINGNINTGLIESLVVEDPVQKNQTTLPCDAWLVFFGLTIKPGPMRQGWEAIKKTEKGLIVVNVENFETSVPKIFAIGDSNTYPGKLKLILSGFHESALMAQKAFEYVFPNKKNIFQYTTSSSALKKKLSTI